MTAILKTLFGSAFTAYIAFITWGNLTLPQKHWVFDKLGIQFDRTIVTPQRTHSPDSPQANISEAITNQASETPSQLPKMIKQAFEQHSIPSLCLKTNTRSIDSVDKTSIYRWTDSEGQIHFSDSKPRQQTSQEVTDRYALDKQYFRMNLTSPEGGLPTLLEEQLQRDVNAIYSYLSDRMKPQYLRQVDLNLKVFNTANGFENYRQIHAPLLNSVAGFYTSINNEAVVMQQRDDRSTRAVARHEAAHVINAGLFGRSPIWFNEGFAEYFGSEGYAKLKTGIMPVNRYHAHYLSSLLKHEQLIPLRDYLMLSESAWRSEDQRTMYAMAWSIIYSLQNHPAGEKFTRQLFTQLAEAPCASLKATDFWEKYYPGGLATFESRWREMLNNPRF